MTYTISNMSEARELAASLAQSADSREGIFIIAVVRRGVGRRQWYEDNTAAVVGILRHHGIECEVRNNSPRRAISGKYIHLL